MADQSVSDVAERATKLLLPNALDEIARTHGNFHYAEYPRTRHLTDGFDTITFEQLANAVDNVARILSEQALARSTSKVVAYLGPNGPMLTVAFIAAMKAGLEIFLPSERNNIPTQLHLLGELECNFICSSDLEFAPLQAIVQAAPETRVIQLPQLADICAPPPKFPFTKTADDCKNQVCFIVHTSGSTGFPKPVRIRYAAVTRMALCLTLPEVPGHESLYSLLKGKRCVDLLPLSHPAGINIGILNAIYNKFTIILPPSQLPPTAQTLANILDHVDADWAATAPLTLEGLSQDTGLTETVTRKLSMLLFSGGGLPKLFGDRISDKVKLLSGMGSSETGPLPVIYPANFDWAQDWNYMKFHPAINIYFDPRPDGTHELTLQRTKESEPYQAVFLIPGSGDQFRSKDLFVPHPAKEGLWTHLSRSDDVIVLLNGEKVNPIQFESIVTSHPKISGALMFGAQRFETGLLLEVAEHRKLTQTEKASILDEVWQKIEEANDILPDHGRIDKSHILFTSSSQPIIRTLKGTVRRQATLDMFKDEVTKLYADVEEMWAPQKLGSALSLTEIRQIVTEAVHTQPKFVDLGSDDDFFNAGMNSLEVLRLVRSLTQKTSVRGLDPSLVYTSPTISGLADAVLQRSQTDAISIQRAQDERQAAIQNVITDLESQLSTLGRPHITTSGSSHGEKRTVVLTGSTGNIGRYLLRELLLRPDVSKIYCLNRAPDSMLIQAKNNKETDSALPSSFDPDRVVFLQADLADGMKLGLTEDQYSSVLLEATDVLHAAWPVDFNQPFPFFRSSLQGLTNLITLCSRTQCSARFVFISSVSAAMGGRDSVPEAIIPDISSCAHAGYAESKWAGEHLCEFAARTAGVPCSVIRLGQIAGAVESEGSWNISDWLPALVLSSHYLGLLPDTLPDSQTIRWMPIDRIAGVIIDLMSTANNGFDVYQPLNPRPVSWSDLSSGVCAFASSYGHGTEHGQHCRVVSGAEWLLKLRASATSTDQDFNHLVVKNPALKLRGFFERQYGTVAGADATERQWHSAKAERASTTLIETGPITLADMQRWMKQWLAKTV